MLARSGETAPGEAGRTIHDPTTGETVTFLETAAESGGERVVMRLGLAPGTVVPPHAHPIEEAFECLAGRLEFRLDGRTRELRPGATVTAPPGRVHGFRTLSPDPAALRIIATPGAEAEYGLRVKFLMSRDGYLPQGGGPPRHLLLAAIVLQRGGLYFPPLPRWLFRALIAGLAALGRWGGREAFLLSRYPEYARYLEALGHRGKHRARPVPRTSP
jgi:quercetin dioxygenase-like cupin family protein